MVAELAELFGAEVHLITISTSNNKRDLSRLKAYSNQAHNYLMARKIKIVSKTLIGDSLPNMTCNYTEAADGDMIVIMSSAIDKWNVFLGSYAQQMLNKSKVPLLSIKPKEKHVPRDFYTFGDLSIE